MTSALSLAGQGFEVYLVEKDSELGGMARRIHYTLEGLEVQPFLSDIVRKVYRHPLIHVSTDAVVVDVSGYVGSFTTTVKSAGALKRINHGVAIIATGAEELDPPNTFTGKTKRS